MIAKGKFTADELAKRTGITGRTVRYYVQEQLIDAPLGRGPGAHYDERHVNQIRSIQLFQRLGVDNETMRGNLANLHRLIAETRHDPDLFAKTFPGSLLGLHLAGFENRQGPAIKPDSDPDEEIDIETAVRLPVADGVELLVRGDVALPSPRRLVDIALFIRKTFDQK